MQTIYERTKVNLPFDTSGVYNAVMAAAGETSLIADRYKILDTLGTGAMGSVYKVLDHKTEQTVALKLLKETREASIEGFKCEFEILKNLRHPHVARILDFGVVAKDPEQKEYYFTEELIEGRDIWSASKTLSFDELEDLFVQALRALEFLHTNNVYHLDLKPSNLLISSGKEPRLKVIDFGLSGFKDTQIILGTPSYTAPEIILSLPRGAPADLYSLGVIFYKCYTRTNPFQSGEVKETWNRQIHLTADPPSSIDPKIPEYMDIILMNLLEKKPSDRYAKAAYVIRSLNYLSGKNYPLETGETFISYLPEEGKLIGRDGIWGEFTQLFKKQFSPDGPPFRLVLLHGARGTGKSRMIKEMRYYAQLCEVPAVDWQEEKTASVPFCWLADFHEPVSEEEKERIKARFAGISQGLAVFAVADVRSLDWLRSWRPDAKTLELKNFSSEEVGQYIISATGFKNLPKTFVEQLYLHCEGTPKLLKEMLKKLMESGELLLLEGHLDEKALVDFTVPWEKVEDIPMLKEIFDERWDRLDSKQKDTLIFISLLGHSAPFEELDIEVLERLMEKGWLRKDPRGQFSLANPAFGSLIIKNLPREKQDKWHDEISQALQSRGVEDWEINFHISFGTRRDRAVAVIPKYVEGCFKRERWDLAKSALDRALDLGVGDAWWGDAMLKWVKAASEGGRAPEIDQAIAQLQGFDMPDRPTWHAEIALAKTMLDLKEKDYHRANKDLQEVFKDGGRGLPKIICLRAKNIEGKILMDQGKLEYAERVFFKNFKEWLALSDEEKIQVTNNDLAPCYFLQQEYEKCWQQLQVELPYYLKLNNVVLLSSCYYLLGCTALKLGKTVDGISYLKKCTAAAKQIQQTDILLLTYNELGNLYFGQRQLDEARVHFEHALNLAQRKKNHSRMALIAANLAVVNAELGQDPQCFSFLQLARRLLDGMVELRVENWVAKGLVLLEFSRYYQRRGKLEEARNYIEEARALARDEAALKVLSPQIEAQYKRVADAQDEGGEETASKVGEAGKEVVASAGGEDGNLERLNKVTTHILEGLEKVETLMDKLVDRLASLDESVDKKRPRRHSNKKKAL